MLVVSLSLAAVMRDLSRSVWVYKLSWVYKLCLGSQTYRVQRFSRKVGGGILRSPYIYIYIYVYTKNAILATVPGSIHIPQKPILAIKAPLNPKP